jgi:small subunit ribosomal protein S18
METEDIKTDTERPRAATPGTAPARPGGMRASTGGFGPGPARDDRGGDRGPGRDDRFGRGGGGGGRDRGDDRDDRGERGAGGNARNRRKMCKFCADAQIIMDYKNPQLLRNFMTDRGKIIPRRITGNCAKHQRKLADAIKRARMIALMPFTVTGK